MVRLSSTTADPRPLTEVELLHYTGQTMVRTESAARQAAVEAERAKDEAARQLRRHKTLPLFIRYMATRFTTESDFADAAILGALSSLPITVLIVTILPLPFLVAAAMWVGIAVFLVGWVYRTLMPTQEEFGADRNAVRREQWFSFRSEHARRISDLDRACKDLLAARRVHERLRFAVANLDVRARLLDAELREMRGIQFVLFLEEAFKSLGYAEVVRNPASRNNGVDLIVRDGDARIAVQAGFRESQPVGVELVQQAFAGMPRHNCQRCAVVTNSKFSAAAVQLAVSTGCRLIDGRDLRRLIQCEEKL